ncbi:MAG TPA: collagen-like protein [Candidatus Saccharimonadales bacterium]|nr:collagen-like protein [Candidatus Saccharimonadales bacterium]
MHVNSGTKADSQTSRKRSHRILFSLFGAGIVLAILLLTMDIYRKSSVIDRLLSIYRSLSVQMSTQQTRPVEQVNLAALDDLSVKVAELVNSAESVQVIEGSPGSAGRPGLDGQNGANGVQGEQGLQGPSGIASCPNGACVSLQTAPSSQETGYIYVDTVQATTLVGDGASVTNLNSAQLTGTISDSRLSSAVTLQGNTFNGTSQLVQTTAAGVLPALSAENLTNLNATNIASGTLNNARLSTSVTLQGNSFNAAGQLVQLDGSAQLPAVSGALLTDINGASISSGTINNARLSTTVTLAGNTFNGASQLVQLDASGLLPALNGSALTNLNASQIATGTLADARLSSNVALLDRDAQLFTGSGTIFRNDTNSASAFSVQNSSSSNVLNVDTSANQTQMTNTTISSSVTVGASGSAISQIRYYTPTLNPANVPAASTSEQTFTVSGLTTDDTVIVNKPSLTSGCGVIGARVSAADTLAISWVNVLGVLGCDPPSEVYKIMALRSP